VTAADRYRVKAAEFAAMSRREPNPELQVAFAQMAQRYLRLSVLADRNSQTDIFYETPPSSSPR